ncbi:MAG UNVERIFIED_CONTAM: hypothetical protein LVR29_22980 [Microcystis novacekii LVE1205-3]|jgi:acetolactate synthase-1/2/3 large subunit
MTPAEIDSSYAPVVEVVGDITDSLDRYPQTGQIARIKPTPVTAGLKTEIRLITKPMPMIRVFRSSHKN